MKRYELAQRRTSLLRVFMVAVAGLLTVMTCGDSLGEGGKSEGKRKSAVVFPVKLFCPSKQAVVFPFKGSVEEICINVGQKVKPGDIMARYSLSVESKIEVTRRLFFPAVKDLEIRLEEAERELLELKQLRERLTGGEKASSKQDTAGMDRRIEAQSRLKEGISDRLRMEKDLAADELELLVKRLGRSVKPGDVPAEGFLVSPVSGYVVWINPEIEEGVESQKGTMAIQVGGMDPLTARAEVFENEALQLARGDKGKIVIESLREREFDAEISYISWVPRGAGVVQPSYYDVKMIVPNPGLLLREGLMGHVTFPRAR